MPGGNRHENEDDDDAAALADGFCVCGSAEGAGSAGFGVDVEHLRAAA